MIVYVKEQGTTIHRSGNTLVVISKNMKRTIFSHRLNCLVLLGSVMLTPAAVSLLCREGIDTFFLTIHGRYKGRLEGEEGKNIYLLKKQFSSLGDPQFCLNIAKKIVSGKLSNMIVLAGRLKRRNKHLQNKLFHEPVEKMKSLLQQIQNADNIPSLRGYEGMGTRHFYRAFRMGFKEDFGFHKRVRRPPTDPVNSVLSLLYTLLFNRVNTAIRLAGLHPMPGYLHSLDYGRYSLALDLMEEFRSLVAETTTLSLFNLKILKLSDFHYEAPPVQMPEAQIQPHVMDDSLGDFYENSDDGFFDVGEQRVEEIHSAEHEPDEKRPCRLNPDALKRVLFAFEEKISSEFTHPLTGATVSYSEAMLHQALLFREVLEEQREHYQPLQLK